MASSKRLRVAVLFGGRSAEHHISLLSARNVLRCLASSKQSSAAWNEPAYSYELVPIAITKQGAWLWIQDWEEVLARGAADSRLPMEIQEGLGKRIACLPGAKGATPLYVWETKEGLDVDIVFPVLHGPYGEDGSLQGILQHLDLPYVGEGVLSSALAMDKIVMKRLLQASSIATAKFAVMTRRTREEWSFAKVKELLGLPFYVKAARQGSSIGVHRISKQHEFLPALEDAFAYDHRLLLEENIEGREVECALLSQGKAVQASLPGEIRYSTGFYSYQRKYFDTGDLRLDMPARLSAKERQLVQETALAVFAALHLEAMGRVDMFLKSDMFLKPDAMVYVNEVNTMPGFTDISMFPGLWGKTSIPLDQLLRQLIDAALERHRAAKSLKIDAC